MKDFRTKLAITAVIFGLGGLGGYAIASNPAQGGHVPSAKIASQSGQSGAGASRISTGTSGAVSTPALNSSAVQTLPSGALVQGGGRDD